MFCCFKSKIIDDLEFFNQDINDKLKNNKEIKPIKDPSFKKNYSPTSVIISNDIVVSSDIIIIDGIFVENNV